MDLVPAVVVVAPVITMMIVEDEADLDVAEAEVAEVVLTVLHEADSVEEEMMMVDTVADVEEVIAVETDLGHIKLGM